MKLTYSSVLQVITWVAGAGSTIGNTLPNKWKPYVLAASGIASVLLHAYAGVHDEQGNKSAVVSVVDGK